MAEMLKFELVSPERRLASADAEAVTVPGVAGDLTAMPNHAPFLTTMRPGVVTVRAGGSETEYVVTGGFVEISPEAVSVLAEEAVEAAEVKGDWIAAHVEAAEKAAEDAPAERAAAEALKLNDMKALAERFSA